MIYLDSCIVIPLTEAEDSVRCSLRHEIAPYLTQGVAISELTRLECRVSPLTRQQDDILRQYDRFFAQPEIRIVPFSIAAWELATRVRAEYALQVPDALHLAVATQSGCQTFCTYDKKLARVAENYMSVFTPISPQGEDHV